MPISIESLLSETKLEPVVHEPSEAERKAFARIQRLVASRERCTHELRERLARDGVEPQAIDAALERAVSCGLVDDIRFASLLISSRVSQGKGQSGIRSELERLGISPEALPGWPDAFFSDDESEFNRALDILRRRPPHAKNVRDAAFRRLVGKGYSHDIAARAARCFAEERIDF